MLRDRIPRRPQIRPIPRILGHVLVIISLIFILAVFQRGVAVVSHLRGVQHLCGRCLDRLHLLQIIIFLTSFSITDKPVLLLNLNRVQVNLYLFGFHILRTRRYLNIKWLTKWRCHLVVVLGWSSRGVHCELLFRVVGATSRTPVIVSLVFYRFGVVFGRLFLD